jgi:membrane protein required for beta-lactamase induction
LQDEFYPAYATHIGNLYWVIAWLPSRLTAFTYALVGNFIPGFEHWKNDVVTTDRCREILIDSGVAALGAGSASDATREENLKAQGMIYRSLIVWVLVVALATLSRAFI